MNSRTWPLGILTKNDYCSSTYYSAQFEDIPWGSSLNLSEESVNTRLVTSWDRSGANDACFLDLALLTFSDFGKSAIERSVCPWLFVSGFCQFLLLPMQFCKSLFNAWKEPSTLMLYPWFGRHALRMFQHFSVLDIAWHILTGWKIRIMCMWLCF